MKVGKRGTNGETRIQVMLPFDSDGSLSRRADRVFRPTTPAMAADVTDHL